MTEQTTSFTMCRHFVLYNAVPANTFDYDTSISPATIYDSVIKSSTGTPAHAKLIIPQSHADDFPDETMICAIARGGPMYPFGYLLHVTRILTLASNTPLYWDVFSHCRITTLCKILDYSSNTECNRAHFTLQTVTNIYGSQWFWTLKYVSQTS